MPPAAFFPFGTDVSGIVPGGGVDPQEAAARRRILESRQRVQDLTEGRADELRRDPFQQSALDFLRGTVQGNQVPFSNAVQNAILAQQGRGFADAEAAQLAALREGLAARGGSIQDPAFQAAQREAFSQRQGRNLDAAGQLATQAGLENFRAQTGAAQNLAAIRAQQNAQINQLGLAGAGFRAQDTAVVGGGANSGRFGGGFGGGLSGDTLDARDARLQALGFNPAQPQGQFVTGSRAPAQSSPTGPATNTIATPQVPQQPAVQPARATIPVMPQRRVQQPVFPAPSLDPNFFADETARRRRPI